MPNGMSLLPPWAAEMHRAIAAYRSQVEARRTLSKHDPAADALDWVVADLELRLSQLLDPTKERTVAAYAAEKGVRPSTVRRWIQHGELDARPTSRGPMIPAGAQRHPRVMRGQHAA